MLLALYAAGQAGAAEWPVGTMIDLNTLGGPSSAAYVVSADGRVVGGAADVGSGDAHAVSWADGATTPTDLGTLAGHHLSVVLAISADGRVLVGQSGAGGLTGHAVSWRNGATRPTDLGTLGGSYSNARAVNADGSVIVGSSNVASGAYRAVSWTNGATTPTDLGTLYRGNYSDAVAVSADGRVIVGEAEVDPRTGESHAASWTNGATTPTDLGILLGGSYSLARGVSADGRVIIGEADVASTDTRAVSWVNGATTPTDLGIFSGGTYSEAVAINADGRVIVGEADVASGDAHAAAWTNGATAPTDLGTLGGTESSAYAVSADGAVIAGEASLASGDSHAVVWMGGATTPTDLGTLGGATSYSNAISADGTVVVGISANANGDAHAFVLRLRAGLAPGQMQDLHNVALSMPALGNDTAQALDRQQALASGLLGGGGCSVQPGRGWCVSGSLGLLARGSDPGRDVGRESGAAGTFSIGRVLNDHTIVGVSAMLASAGGLGDSAVSGGTTRGIGLWAAYSQGGMAGTGLQLDGGLAYARTDDASLMRGMGLANVQVAPGAADISTAMASVRIGYGFESKGWLLTPSLGIAATRATRSAYSEAAGLDFPAEFRDLAVSATTATLALSASRSLGAGKLGLVAGMGVDLQVDDVRLEGTSTIPGLGTIAQKATLDRNRLRPLFGVSYSQPVGARGDIAIGASLARATYGDKPAASVGVTYSLSF